MIENTEMPKGIFYIIVALCAAIIGINALETLMRAKDILMFEQWQSELVKKDLINQTNQQLYSTYITYCLGAFMMRVITPIGLALHSYYALTKVYVNRWYVIIWNWLLFGSILFISLGEKSFSIFYILTILLTVGIIITINYLNKIIKFRQMI